jgi:hypothetical protein
METGTCNKYLWGNPHTGHPTGIHCEIKWTCVLQRAWPQDFAVAKSCFDWSSDHSPILITLRADALHHANKPILSNMHTNWDNFRRLVNERLTLNILLNIEDVEAAAEFFNDDTQWSGWNTAPLKAYDCPIMIKQRIEGKRRLRTELHRLRTPTSNRSLNAATQELKGLHDNKNACIQTFLFGLTPT